MRGIRMSFGTCFVEQDGVTVKIKKNGECGLSPVMYDVLEWDLRCEPPESWDYISEYDVKQMGDGVYEKVMEIIEKHIAMLK